MKLGKQPSSLWVAERRGRVVFTRGGKTGAPGVPKAREHKTDEAAQAFLEAERDKRLADGYVMLAENAGLDTPFTLDGKPRARTVPAKYTHVADIVRMHARAGIRTREEMASLVDDLANEYASAARRESSTRRQSTMTMEARTRDIEVHARAAAADPTEGDEKLRELLAWVADTERVEVRRTPKPSPCVNESIDAAFEALGREGIVALQAAGFTQSDGWDDASAEAERLRARGQAPRGACFYHEQDLARGVRGEGLTLSFGAFGAGDGDPASLEVGRTIAKMLRAHGIDVVWNETTAQRIQIAPFVWWRAPA